MKDIPYASAVGSLMYAQTCTRPDIAFAIGLLGWYQSNPGMDHVRTAKKVMGHLKGILDHMLVYSILHALRPHRRLFGLGISSQIYGYGLRFSSIEGYSVIMLQLPLPNNNKKPDRCKSLDTKYLIVR